MRARARARTDVRIDVSLLTTKSREIYISEHIVGRHGRPIGDRACRGDIEIIVIASDKSRATSTRFHYVRERRDLAPVSSARTRSLTAVTIRFLLSLSIFVYGDPIGRDAHRDLAIYARVKAHIGLSGEIRIRVPD